MRKKGTNITWKEEWGSSLDRFPQIPYRRSVAIPMGSHHPVGEVRDRDPLSCFYTGVARFPGRCTRQAFLSREARGHTYPLQYNGVEENVQH